MALEPLNKNLIDAIWERFIKRVKTSSKGKLQPLVYDINAFREEIKETENIGIGRYSSEDVSERTLGRALKESGKDIGAEEILKNLLYFYAYFEGNIEVVKNKIKEDRELQGSMGKPKVSVFPPKKPIWKRPIFYIIISLLLTITTYNIYLHTNYLDGLFREEHYCDFSGNDAKLKVLTLPIRGLSSGTNVDIGELITTRSSSMSYTNPGGYEVLYCSEISHPITENTANYYGNQLGADLVIYGYAFKESANAYYTISIRVEPIIQDTTPNISYLDSKILQTFTVNSLMDIADGKTNLQIEDVINWYLGIKYLKLKDTTHANIAFSNLLNAKFPNTKLYRALKTQFDEINDPYLLINCVEKLSRLDSSINSLINCAFTLANSKCKLKQPFILDVSRNYLEKAFKQDSSLSMNIINLSSTKPYFKEIKDTLITNYINRKKILTGKPEELLDLSYAKKIK